MAGDVARQHRTCKDLHRRIHQVLVLALAVLVACILPIKSVPVAVPWVPCHPWDLLPCIKPTVPWLPMAITEVPSLPDLLP